MTKAKHTPGPWLAIKEGGAAEPAIISGDETYIASAHVGMKDCDSVTWANARLIAAAPDLLEALEEIRDMLWSRPDISDRLRPLMGFAEEATNQKAATAIAKAKVE